VIDEREAGGAWSEGAGWPSPQAEREELFT
jgi:hypothetical protein